MLRNLFKITWRNLLRYKAISLINITGLAMGMWGSVLILMWVQNELSFDQFHENKDRIYQLYRRVTVNGKVECWNGLPMKIAPVLRLDQPQIEEIVRVNGVSAFILTAGEKHLQASGYLTDPGFLKIFSFPMLKGNPQTALSSSRSIVVEEKFGKKLFGSDDPIGKVIKIDSNAYFKVTGVVKALPNNTRFDFDYMVPWSYMKEVGWENEKLEDNSVETFVLLKPGINEKTANERFANVIRSHSNANEEIFVHPMSKWWLYSEFENGKISGGRIESVRFFGIIAAFILVIACINYMNLSTARSIRRAKEIGIRKVVGAQKRSLILQFLGESIMISCLSGIIALIIVQLSLGWFNELTYKKLFIHYQSLNFWLTAISFILATGIVAGIYPALYLSAQKPINALKGVFKTGRTLIAPRKILVVLQFTFSIGFIICTIVVYSQVNYGLKRDPGYNWDHLVFMYVNGDVNNKYGLIRNELMQGNAVTSVTRSNSPITTIWSGDDGYSWSGKNPDVKFSIAEFHTDNDFVKTMSLKIVSGRDINTYIYPTDSTAVLLNESSAKLMGFKDPIGQNITNKDGTWHIIGIVKDFIPGSPYEPVPPMIIQGPKNWFGTVTFKLNGRNPTADNLKNIESVVKKYNPDYPFIYRFVDESYAESFQYLQHTGVQAALFGGLAIIISCLGLFALATNMAESRTKEIGVRKVLGASVGGITVLLSLDFFKLIIISFIIASPLAWWAMHSWLENYTYRVSIDWWVFALAGLLSIFIAIASVSYQAIKAALANPAKSLRIE